MPSVAVTRIPNLDQPLYRIFQLKHFDSVLRGKLTLMRPGFWEDPHEDLCARTAFSYPGKHEQRFLDKYLEHAFAQCWSFEGDSDVLFRAYSRVFKDGIGRNAEKKFEGVQVKTTPKKLIHALNAFTQKLGNADPKFYLGSVLYLSEDDIKNEICNRLNAIGPIAMGRGTNRADMLFLKRRAFLHESEVRILALSATTPADQRMYEVDIDPNALIDELQFDPRVSLAERMEHKKWAEGLGYKNNINDNGRYRGLFLDAMLTKDWDQ